MDVVAEAGAAAAIAESRLPARAPLPLLYRITLTHPRRAFTLLPTSLTNHRFRVFLKLRKPRRCVFRPSLAPPLSMPVVSLCVAATAILGLCSRLSLLEMQFRRLLTCAPVTLNDAGTAPAGPGVFLLSDSDLTSYYYVEACQTLRIAIPNLLRGGSTRRGADSIKPQLADHLGIPETRVGKYLTDHCVVRWLQLDEGASHFAHFVTAVLRPILNE